MFPCHIGPQRKLFPLDEAFPLWIQTKILLESIVSLNPNGGPTDPAYSTRGAGFPRQPHRSKAFPMPLHRAKSSPPQTILTIRPAVVTVGDELMFGERPNDNQQWLLEALQERGHPAELALTLPDAVAIIAVWLRTLLREHCFPVLVSGGLGGTHDDCTREGIANTLQVPLTRHHDCFEILAAKYGEQFTAGRQRMAMLPEGCELIANPIGAPGFFLAGVYAFPGFPNMLRPMVNRGAGCSLARLRRDRLAGAGIRVAGERGNDRL